MAVVADVSTELGAAVDALCGADPAGLADGASVQALYRQLDRLSAVVSRASAAFGRRPGLGGGGGQDGRVVDRSALSPAGEHGPPARAAGPGPAPHAGGGGGLAGGRGGRGPRGVAGWGPNAGTAELFARDESWLVSQAASLRYSHLARAVAYWRQLADPDGADASAEAQHRARRLHLSATFDGSWALDALLDPLNGAIVARALGRIEKELFESDWAEARARVGEGACSADLARTPAQRRADALVEMARRSGAMPAGARLPEPLFTVLVGYETFAGRICELAGGSVVAPGALVRWLDEAWVERVVFDGPDRVTNVGVRRRIFTGATRRAVEVRDRECFREFCEVPAGDCEIDHVQPWAAGGLTVESNGRVACGYHNRRRHRLRGPP